MTAHEEVIERYRRYLSEGQRRKLRKTAEALSLANAARRMKLAGSDAERIGKTNALLTDYGLATGLYHAPVSGIDAYSRRPSPTETGAARLNAEETAALESAAQREEDETARAREAAKKKKRSAAAPAKAAAGAVPGRSVTVRKL